MTEGVRRAAPDALVRAVPVSDGGDGLLEMVRAGMAVEDVHCHVRGPRGAPTNATFCYLQTPRTAIIEMAQAAGLVLLSPAERDPTQTTTYGVGELVRAALDHGARRILLGLGGSATCDGGIGMAAALGVRFFDAQGHELAPNGGALGQIAQIDVCNRHPLLIDADIIGLCDVDNPLYGPRGAAQVFAPQKGATPAQVAQLDAGLRNLAAVLARELHCAVAAMPGAGAAGGLGAGVCAWLGGRLRPGADTLLDAIAFDDLLRGADLVLTAEGHLDTQSLGGKAPIAVARRARAHGVPCILIAGTVADELGPLHAEGVTAAVALCRAPMSVADAMRDAAALLRDATEQIVRAAG